MDVTGSVGLFCSASDGLPPAAGAAAAAFGAACARSGLRLVYGGSSRGLMGIAARAAMAAGGQVVGVMPRHLVARERATAEITELHLVDSLAARKQMMADLSDIFVALPGGVGTLDEAVEMITWFDTGVHRKPTLMCNIDGFWDFWPAMIAAMDSYGVCRPGLRGAFRMVADVDAAVAAVREHLAGPARAAAG